VYVVIGENQTGLVVILFLMAVTIRIAIVVSLLLLADACLKGKELLTS